MAMLVRETPVPFLPDHASDIPGFSVSVFENVRASFVLAKAVSMVNPFRIFAGQRS